MRHIPIAAFKDRVSEFIAAAEAGEEVIITRHGKVAARLLPPDNLVKRQAVARDAMAKLKIMRERMRAEGRTATIEEMIEWKNEGRK